MNTSPGLTPDPLPDHVSEELVSLRKKLSRAYYHLRRVIGDHNAPGDCYSTGPHEGNAMDHICPSCAALRELGEELKGHQ